MDRRRIGSGSEWERRGGYSRAVVDGRDVFVAGTAPIMPGDADPPPDAYGQARRCLEIVEAASQLFERVVVAPMRNTQKGEPLFTLEERRDMIAASVVHLPNVTIASLSSLVVDLAKEIGADVIIKGLRVASDAEAELQQAQMNRKVAGVETLFIPSSSEYSFIANAAWVKLYFVGSNRTFSLLR